MDLSTGRTLWLASLRSAGRSERTIASYDGHVTAFATTLSAAPAVSDVTYAAVASYQRRLGARLAPRTVGLALTAIRSFCRFCVDAELLGVDPTARIVYPKLGKALPKALSRAQIRRLVAALAVPDDLLPAAAFQWRRNRLAILLMLYAGLRIGEVRDLRWRDVDLDAARLVVRAGKGDKDRTIPIHVALLGDLRLAAEGRRGSDAVCGHGHGAALSGKSLHHVFERWVPQLDLGFHLTAHMLRHTFITQLIDAGANVFEAQELAGHEDPKTTRGYYRLSAEHLRAAVGRLPSSW